MNKLTLGILFTLLTTSIEVSAQSLVTLANLRAQKGTPPATVFLSDIGKEGLFYYSPSDSGKADDGGIIIATADGKRYRRSFSGAINAKWFGMKENDPSFDNAPALMAAIAASSYGQEILLDANYYFNNSITIPKTKKIKLTSLGNLIFGKKDGFIIQGTHNIYIENITGLSYGANGHPSYDEMVGSGIILNNSSNSDITVQNVYGFRNAIVVKGSMVDGNINGSQYNKIQFSYLNRNKVGILITTDNVGKNWVNENTFTGGRITGVTGLLMAKGAEQTDRFNGNKFYNIGFENLVTCIDVSFAYYNSFNSPRFELFTNGISFKNGSSDNTIISASIYEKTFVNIGPRTMFIGTLLTPSGVRAGNINIGTDEGDKFVSLSTKVNVGGVASKETTGILASLTQAPARKSITVNQSYFVTPDYSVVFVDSSSNSEIYFPNVAVYVDREITIKNVSSTRLVKAVGIDPNDVNVIQPGGSMTVKSDGIAWRKI